MKHSTSYGSRRDISQSKRNSNTDNGRYTSVRDCKYPGVRHRANQHQSVSLSVTERSCSNRRHTYDKKFWEVQIACLSSILYGLQRNEASKNSSIAVCIWCHRNYFIDPLPRTVGGHTYTHRIIGGIYE